MIRDDRSEVQSLQGPILVLGASGFVGANLFLYLQRYRQDVYGTTSHASAWRLEGAPATSVITVDLLVEHNLVELLDVTRPRTIFDCVAYGGYSFEQDTQLIYRTNLNLKVRLLEELKRRESILYIHAGSSSEYGYNASAPLETDPVHPNSHYAVSKSATSELLYYLGKSHGLACANLRLYSVYGPYEDSSRLVPALVSHGLRGTYPPFVDPDVSRDLVYVEDVCRAFVAAALRIREEWYGESFNVGTGIKTNIAQIAALAKDVFDIPGDPAFTMSNREWDLPDWYANTQKTRQCLEWQHSTSLRDGLIRTADWYKGLAEKERYAQSSKRYGLDQVYSVSAIVACYRDAQAIPIMYERLKKVLTALKIDYEIIFVNDGSPDDSEQVIREISARDRQVLGITHSRNFGSQAAFRSGMELASKNACVLLDGDLQDPPELIAEFVKKWREGYDVVYGRRVKREAPWHMQAAYKLFYRLFDRFSYVPIPRDAGDFSLMNRKVVLSLLKFPERDLFIRGIRAFAGFQQIGVDYHRPERMFGVSTNSLLKNIGWAKKGILSFSNTPLNILSVAGLSLFGVSVLLALVQVLARLAFPDSVPKGITTTLLTIIFFGSVNLLAISIIGEYLAKIFEEVKRRPHFIRKGIIKDGEIRVASEEQAVTDGIN